MLFAKIKFYSKKVKRASIAEMVFRMSTLFTQKIERYLYNYLPFHYLNNENRIVKKIKKKNTKKNDVSFFIPFNNIEKSKEYIKKKYPEWYFEAIENAENVLKGRIHRLGIDFDVSGKINWHQDPVTKKEYPLKYYREIRIFGGDYGMGDIKHIWEVNRHQYLIDIAKAYFLTNEQKYYVRIVTLLKDWVESNPYNFGVNWTSGLEVAVRALAWIWVYFFIKNSSLFTEKEKHLFLVNIYRHGKYLQKHLSLYFSPYNHLVGESSVLYLIGLLFPELPASAQRKKKGWKILSKIISKQFYKDGFTKEQASFYHHFTLGFYMQVYLLAKQNNQKVDARFESYLKKAIKASQSLTAPNGKIPKIGDCDDAQSIYLKYDISWDFSFFHQLGFILFGIEQYGTSKRPKEELFWLLGSKAVESYSAIDRFVAIPLVENLNDSGYFILRSQNDKETIDYLLFDYGEICDGIYNDDTASAGHGHADLLQFEFHPFGIPWLVDQGFYTYNGPLEWHKEFRCANSHNTITIDDKSMLQHQRRLSWAYRPKLLGGKIIFDENITVLIGKYEGFRHFRSPVTHERILIRIENELWIVIDKLLGMGKHIIKQNFNFHPNIEVRLDGKRGFESFYKNKYLLRGYSITEPKAIVSRKGDHNYPDSWFAPSYNELLPAWHLAFIYETDLPAILCNYLLPTEQATENKIKINSSNINLNYIKIDFSFNERDIKLFINLTGQKISMPGMGDQIDALLIYESRDRHGNLLTTSILK